MFKKLMAQPIWFKRFLNLWPPYLAAGIRLEKLADDFSSAEVSLTLKKTNTNYVGTHFGGSLYSMTDPFYMLLLMNRLGKDYIMWDKSAEIEFKRPGKGKVTAIFHATDEMVADIKEKTKNGEKYFPVYTVDVIDEQGKVVASVKKTLYAKLKDRALEK
jgi:acyl-coenzyme A thioesterase PaaI-like protein